ncbi:MAG: hypothetical protein K8H86_07070 [Ignavibacteriaceae bacterium]|nr:hypothetical protein [Ignavibacteriaceae bacterium]
MKNFVITFLFLCSAVAFETFAQAGGINLTLGFPAGEFKENVSRTGVGISGQFMFLSPRPKAPFGFGINIGYINYGSESRREPFSLTIPDVTVDVDRTNNIMNFHVVFQLMFPKGDVRPYVEGLFGGSYLFTETKIESQGSQEVASSTNFDDFAWSYGGGGGFLVKVHSGGEDGDVGDVFLDIKARYLFGSEAEYLKEGSVKIIRGKVYYDVTRSKTDLLTAHLGVVAFFNSLFR